MPEQLKIVLMREEDKDYLAHEIPASFRLLGKMAADYNLGNDIVERFYSWANTHESLIGGIWNSGFDAVEVHERVPGFTDFVIDKTSEILGVDLEIRRENG